eukprot:TRINITY_DN2523_c0_g1_i3.p2 TRINITY_DN2523_c0_g1~~TRINITY_DN2523_c0_g1_i3.p2  ORF type:complete len:236 (+),score=42.96 TRINITY_DN2523_c0_g1_i3:67-774(+)
MDVQLLQPQETTPLPLNETIESAATAEGNREQTEGASASLPHPEEVAKEEGSEGEPQVAKKRKYYGSPQRNFNTEESGENSTKKRKKSRSVSREREKEGETEEEREKKRARGKEWERGGKFPRDTAEDCCFNCGEPGHHQVECPKPGRTFDSKNCYLCGRKGHTSKFCPDKFTNRYNFFGYPPYGPNMYPPVGYPPYYYMDYENRDHFVMERDKVCFTCGREGHISKDCPEGNFH